MHSFKRFLAEREEAAPAKGVTVHGIHYSNKPGLDHLDGRFSGTGIKGAEGKRLQWTKDERIKKRVYFYNHKPEEHGPLPPVHEGGLGQHVHSATLHGIYDPATAHPDERAAISKTAGQHKYNGEEEHNDFERAVLDHGYHGYTNGSMTVILNSHHVPVKYLGHKQDVLNKATETA
jgi:hypothetical protein